MTEDTEVKINYAFSKNASEQHKKNCHDAVSVLFGYINDSKIAVVDCVYADDHSKGETILAALIESESGSAVLPLAKLFQDGEDVSNALVPCIKLEAPAEAPEEATS